MQRRGTPFTRNIRSVDVLNGSGKSLTTIGQEPTEYEKLHSDVLAGLKSPDKFQVVVARGEELVLGDELI
jgi:hypothetical protein